MNMDKYFMWIYYERLHNHNKAKHNNTVCIFLGIYCTSDNWVSDPIDKGLPSVRIEAIGWFNNELASVYGMECEQNLDNLDFARNI